jgi:NADPH:quinone reductase-like Zn-dependent oxidoreductase
MKAFYLTGFGGPEVMHYGDLPDPAPGTGEVLVEVKAASINPLDWKLRSGMMRLLSGRGLPKALGADFAGVVRALGPGVSRLALGASVYGSVGVMFGAPGAHAERVAAKLSHLHPLPEGWSFEQGAALPVAGLTALAGLRKCGELTGKTVLVNGATGGVGHLALQIAKARGARVVGVCSADGHSGKALLASARQSASLVHSCVTTRAESW